MTTRDIAELGILIDASQARQSREELRALAAQGAKTETAMGLVTSAAKLMATAFAAMKLAKLIEDTALLNARFETMGVVLRVAGNNAGYTSTQMAGLEKDLQKTGITMIKSREALTSLATANIDLSKASRLARAAQDLAVVGNTNSSEAFGRLVAGIKSGEVEVLRTLGLNVNFENSYKKLASQLGTTSEKLTEQQKLQARTNVTLQAATMYNGIYEESLGTAGKKLQSLARYVEDAKVKIGETFNAALTVGVDKLTDALKAANLQLDQLGSSGTLANIGQGISTGFQTAFQAVTVFGANTLYVLSTIGKELGAGAAILQQLFTGPMRALNAMAAALDALFRGDFAGAKQALSGAIDELGNSFRNAKKISEDVATETENDRKAVDAFSESILKSSVAVKEQTAEQKAAADAKEQARIRAGKDARAAQEAEDKRLAAAEAARAQQKKYDETFKSTVKSIQERTAAIELDMTTEGKLTEGQKYAVTIMEDLRAGTLKLSDNKKRALAVMLEEYLTVERINAARDAERKAAQAAQAETDAEVGAIEAQAAALKEQFESYNKLPAVITAVAVAKLEARKAALESGEGTEEEIIKVNRLIFALQNRAKWEKAVQDQSQGADTTKALELLNIMKALDDAAKAAAGGMAKAFGNVGKAIGDLTTAITGYGVAQATVAAKLAQDTASAKGDPVKLEKAKGEALKKTTQLQLKSYGDMAAGAKGFFKENTAGYRAMEGAEKAFRAFEMALAIKTELEKSGLISMVTGLFVTGEATKTAAATASLAPQLAIDTAKGTSAAAVGVATQAQGDPYTSWARMAAMAAVMAGLGFAVFGGGGGSASQAKTRQASAGTGTIPGDDTAKSDSIAKAIEDLDKNSDIGLTHTAGMLASLRAIESNIAGLANVVLRNSGLNGKADPKGVTTGTAFGKDNTSFYGPNSFSAPLLMKLPGVASVFTKLFGTTTSVVDQGIAGLKTTLGRVQDEGVRLQSYADINTKRKTFGFTTSNKTSTQFSDLSQEVNDQFALVIKSLAEGVKVSAGLLGVEGDAFDKQLRDFVVSFDEISIKGLSADEVQKQFETTFAKLGDQMAASAVSGLQGFAQVGEGYLQTLARIAADYANVDSIFESMGKAFGTVGLASVAAREKLIDLAGGVDKLAEKTSFFVDKFFTDAEKAAPQIKYAADELAKLGLSGLDTADKFKEKVMSLAGDPAQLELYNKLLSLAPAVWATVEAAETAAEAQKDLAKAQEDAAKAAHDAAQAAADQLWTNYNDATSIVSGIVSAEKTRLGELHQASMDSIQRRIDAEEKGITKLQSLSDALHSTLSQLTVPGQEATERRDAQAQIKTALAIARAGGPLPTADTLKGALSVVSKDSSDMFSTYLDYQRDAVQTAKDISDLSKITDTQLSVAQRQLAVLQEQLAAEKEAYEAAISQLDGILTETKKQSDLLLGISTAMSALPGALAAVQAAIAAIKLNPVASAGGSVTAAYQDYLKRDPSSSEVDYWTNAITGGVDAVGQIKGSNEAKVQDLYKNILGRTGEAGGVDFWTKALNNGASVEQLTNDFYNSEEYKSKHLGPVGAAGTSDSTTVAAAISDMKTEVSAALREVSASSRRTSKTLESFDYNGMPSTREEGILP